MNRQELDQRAKALWDAMQSTKPDWGQLGEVTKSVWRQYVLDGLTPEVYLPKAKKPAVVLRRRVASPPPPPPPARRVVLRRTSASGSR